jgi:hypothetical protein
LFSLCSKFYNFVKEQRADDWGLKVGSGINLEMSTMLFIGAGSRNPAVHKSGVHRHFDWTPASNFGLVIVEVSVWCCIFIL